MIQHVRNVLDADRKGVDIGDVNYFDLFEYDESGICGIPAQDAPSPLKIDNQEVYVLEDTFKQPVYNIEVPENHTYFIIKRGLWVQYPHYIKTNDHFK